MTVKELCMQVSQGMWDLHVIQPSNPKSHWSEQSWCQCTLLQRFMHMYQTWSD